MLGLLVGAVVGAFGGGGGVLTLPALVYLLGQPAQAATTGSVVLVGVTATAGVLARLRGKRIDWRTGAAYVAVGIPAAAAGSIANQAVPERVLLLAFAALALVAAATMLLGGHPDPAGDGPSGAPRRRVAVVVGSGVLVGFLTGFLGVGGGFLVVPALVVLLRMPMATAVGTSLLIILGNSVAALGTRAAGLAALDWAVLGPFVATAVVGGVAGKAVAERLSGRTLERAFAVLLVLVGGAVAVANLG